MEITVWENSSKRIYWEDGEWYIHFKHICKINSCGLSYIFESISYEWYDSMYEFLLKGCG